MARSFGIERLMAVVHPNNYCVLLRYSDFWSFKTPIYDEWIKDPDARALLQKASSGQGSLPEELRQVLLEHVYCGCGRT